MAWVEGKGLMTVRNVDLSPTCCCLDRSVDGIVVICTALQNDRSDKYIAPDEADQYHQCILSYVDQKSRIIKILACIIFACLLPYLLS